MIPKYEIGDWFYDNTVNFRDHFWQIRGIHEIKERESLRKYIVYDVAFMKCVPESLEFRHWGDLSWVEECELQPVTDIADIMRCKISDAQSAYLKARKEAGRLKADLDSLLRSQELL